MCALNFPIEAEQLRKKNYPVFSIYWANACALHKKSLSKQAKKGLKYPLYLKGCISDA